MKVVNTLKSVYLLEHLLWRRARNAGVWWAVGETARESIGMTDWYYDSTSLRLEHQ